MSEQTLHTILMPKWGLAMHEGVIAGWTVSEGDEIAEGQALCDIETNKITNEFEIPVAGTVARLVRPAGSTVGVGEVIAVIAGDEVDAAEIDALIERHNASVEGADDEGDNAIQTLETDAGTIAYLETGASDASRTVLLLHVFGGDHGNWGMLQAVLPAEVRALALDLPGHGSSTKRVGDGTAGALARSVVAFLRAKDIGSVDLVAHSFGANVAAAVVAEAPDLARSLTVIAPPDFGAQANPDYIEGFMAARRKKDMRPVMELLFSNPGMVSRPMINEAVATYRDEEARAALGTIAKAIGAQSSDAARDAGLARKHDVTVIWGDRDRVVPMPEGAADALEDRLHVIAGAGHMPHVEAVEQVSAILLTRLGS